MSLQLIKLNARFVHADTDNPLKDPNLRVRFYDKNLLKDSFLGESALNDNGEAEIIVNTGSALSGLVGRLLERLKEKKPDVFCQIVDATGTAVFQTAVQWNIDVSQFNEVTQRPRPTVDLGTFAFRPGDGLTDPLHYAGVPRPLM